MGVGGAVVQVEDDHTEDDGEGDEDHGEHDVVDDDGDAQGRLGDLISEQQQEDGEGQQHVDGQTHLFTWWGQKKTSGVEDSVPRTKFVFPLCGWDSMFSSIWPVQWKIPQAESRNSSSADNLIQESAVHKIIDQQPKKTPIGLLLLKCPWLVWVSGMRIILYDSAGEPTLSCPTSRNLKRWGE